MSIQTTRENWLIDAGKLGENEVLYLYPRDDLDQSTALDALDAQYGRGIFDTWQHGSALRIARRAFRNYYGETYKRFSHANEFFWDARRKDLPKEEIDRRREAVKEPKRIWEALLRKSKQK